MAAAYHYNQQHEEWLKAQGSQDGTICQRDSLFQREEKQ